MKKNTRISVPRRVVLPLAAAALLAACDERSAATTYKATGASVPKSGSTATAKGRSAATRPGAALTRRNV